LAKNGFPKNRDRLFGFAEGAAYGWGKSKSRSVGTSCAICAAGFLAWHTTFVLTQSCLFLWLGGLNALVYIFSSFPRFPNECNCNILSFANCGYGQGSRSESFLFYFTKSFHLDITKASFLKQAFF